MFCSEPCSFHSRRQPQLIASLRFVGVLLPCKRLINYRFISKWPFVMVKKIYLFSSGSTSQVVLHVISSSLCTSSKLPHEQIQVFSQSTSFQLVNAVLHSAESMFALKLHSLLRHAVCTLPMRCWPSNKEALGSTNQRRVLSNALLT